MNYAINHDGWELVPFKPCYWSVGVVYFNGHPFKFNNNTWEPITPEIVVPDRDLAHTFRFNDEKDLRNQHRANPSYADTVVNYAAVMADIVATFSEHQEWDYGKGQRRTRTSYS